MNMSADQLDHCHCNIPPQTKRGFERRLAFVLSATTLFLEKGYDDVSLDDVVNHAGGSKASIYKYFGNKKGLFKAICDYRRDMFFQELFRDKSTFEQLDLEAFLFKTLENFYLHISKIENQKFIRLLVEQVKHNPDLSEYLYKECPEKILELVSQKLICAHQKNIIVCENPVYTTQMYLGILWHIEWQILMGVPLSQNFATIQPYIQYSVKSLLKSVQYR